MTQTTDKSDGVKQVETPDGTLTYNDDNHNYNLDGIEVPSTSDTTGVLDKSGPLLGWLSKLMCNSFREQIEPETEYSQSEIEDMIEHARKARWRTSNEALNIGSAAHDWFERHITDQINGGDGIDDDLPDREPVLEAVVEFLDWEEEHVTRWLRSEDIVAIPTSVGVIGGTFDALAETDHGLLVVDFKTSKSIYDSHLLQAGGYFKGVQHTYGSVPDGFCILRTPKDTAEVEPYVVTDSELLSTHVDGFNAAANLYNWRESNGL